MKTLKRLFVALVSLVVAETISAQRVILPIGEQSVRAHVTNGVNGVKRIWVQLYQLEYMGWYAPITDMFSAEALYAGGDLMVEAKTALQNAVDLWPRKEPEVIAARPEASYLARMSMEGMNVIIDHVQTNYWRYTLGSEGYFAPPSASEIPEEKLFWYGALVQATTRLIFTNAHSVHWVEYRDSYPATGKERSRFTRTGWNCEEVEGWYGQGRIYILAFDLSGDGNRWAREEGVPGFRRDIVVWYDEDRTKGELWNSESETGESTLIGNPFPPTLAIRRGEGGGVVLSLTSGVPGASYVIEAREGLDLYAPRTNLGVIQFQPLAEVALSEGGQSDGRGQALACSIPKSGMKFFSVRPAYPGETETPRAPPP